jgi:hypothetical protein
MMAPNSLRQLSLLAQLDSFQDTIRHYMYKYSENKVMVLVYALGCIIVVTLIYQLLARKK